MLEKFVQKVSPGISKLLRDIRTDFTVACKYKDKYSGNTPSQTSLCQMLVTNIGFQSTAAIRCMQFARNSGIPLAGESLSRLIRHIYGMEIHWMASIAPGISIAHGNGIVVSKYAKIEHNCILMQNVTLGASRDHQTKVFGAPTLEESVHVGPGATLLGPITIGRGSKVMAGSVVTSSVPPFSLVRPASVSVSRREPVSRSSDIKSH